MVKAIIFDFWGTLVETGTWSPLKQVKNILLIEAPFSEYVVRMEKVFMTKEFPTLKDGFKQVCREFRIESSEDQIERLIGVWNTSWMLAKPYPDVEEVLQQLKQKYLLFLVSNTDCFSVPKVMDRFKLAPYFTRMFFSYQLSLLKTDVKFMKFFLQQTELRPEDCIFVGDSIESDMSAAEKMAIRGILIDRKNTRSYNPKINNLKELIQHL
ncbi:HAD family hydrolase [Candidatus Woesearchaeota archaeon]|nr:HAD family hydrolase [Candidatus Woesearchaeota archaeon]